MTNSSETNKLQCVPPKLKHTRSEAIWERISLWETFCGPEVHASPATSAGFKYPLATWSWDWYWLPVRCNPRCLRTPADTLPHPSPVSHNDTSPCVLQRGKIWLWISSAGGFLQNHHHLPAWGWGKLCLCLEKEFKPSRRQFIQS